MSEKQNDSVPESDEKVLSITRIFDAPRHLVFEAWTNPKHLKRWFAAHGFDIPDAQWQMQPGGKWHSSMSKPNGVLLKMGGVCQEIVPDKKLVFTHAWDEETGGTGHETVITVTFEDQGEKTLMHFHQAFFLSKEVRDDHRTGWTEFLERLDAYLIDEVLQ